MILVVGATGLLGGEVCRRLRAKGQAVRALVRETSDMAKKQALLDSGTTLATGDLKDKASLLDACRGVAAVVSTASSTLSRQPNDSIETVDLQGQLNLVEAAKANGIDRFIFVSFRHNPQNPSPLAEAKQAVERALRDLNYTILQASFFMQVWLTPMLGFDYANAKARIYGSGENGISWISVFDVAEFCVASLENPAAQRAVIEVGGPQALSLLGAVRIFEQESGRKFELEHIPVQSIEAQMGAATNSLEKSLAALMLGASRGDVIDMRPVLERFPIQLASLRDYAKQVLEVKSVKSAR
jgi:uncharacterized protein YbjT (DUF2867 family)